MGCGWYRLDMGSLALSNDSDGVSVLRKSPWSFVVPNQHDFYIYYLWLVAVTIRKCLVCKSRPRNWKHNYQSTPGITFTQCRVDPPLGRISSDSIGCSVCLDYPHKATQATTTNLMCRIVIFTNEIELLPNTAGRCAGVLRKRRPLAHPLHQLFNYDV